MNEKQWFCGIYGIEFVWRGNWNDPELKWHNKSFNYYDVELPLWYEYREYCNENNLQHDETQFPIWVKANARLVRDILQHLKDHNCFYGGK